MTMDADKYRQIEIVTNAVRKAIAEGSDLLMLLELPEGERIFALQGTPVKLTLLAVLAMRENAKFAQVFDIALKVYRGEKPEGIDRKLMELFKMLFDFEPLNCDKCPPEIRDTCEVRDQMHCERDMPDELERVLNEIFNRKEDNENE